MTQQFVKYLLENSQPAVNVFQALSLSNQIEILTNANMDIDWENISKQRLSIAEMEKFSDHIHWEHAIKYNDEIPLHAIKIKKRSVAQYVARSFKELPEILVKKKFCRNKNFHDRIEAVYIWYSSPQCRQILEEVYGFENLFNIRHYTTYTLVLYLEEVFNNLTKIKKFSNLGDIPAILLNNEDLENVRLDLSTGNWYACKNCIENCENDSQNSEDSSLENVACEHFPLLKNLTSNYCCNKLHY